MSFMKKEKELLEAMKKDGYNTMFQGNKTDALDFMTNHLTSFVNHANNVITRMVNEPIWKEKYELSDFQAEKQAALDREARSLGAVTHSMESLNRLCSSLNMEPMFRNGIGKNLIEQEVGEIIMDIYHEGTGTSMGIYKNAEIYDEKKVPEYMKALDKSIERNNSSAGSGYDSPEA